MVMAGLGTGRPAACVASCQPRRQPHYNRLPAAVFSQLSLAALQEDSSVAIGATPELVRAALVTFAGVACARASPTNRLTVPKILSFNNLGEVTEVVLA